MSIDKTTMSDLGKKPATSAIRGHAGVAGVKPPEPEIVSLEIDDNDDFGGDPYNRTGSHCVLKISKDD